MLISKSRRSALMILLALIFSFISCKQNEIKFSGFNDLVAGTQRITLYENGEFYLEMSLGGTNGTYKMKSDTVVLNYSNNPSNSWPEKFIIKENCFETINSGTSISKTRIRRLK